MDFADGFSNIYGIVKECGELIEKSIKDFDDGLKEQTLKLDKVYNDLLLSAKMSIINIEENKISTKTSESKSQVEGVSAEQSSQRNLMIENPHSNVPKNEINNIKKSTIIANSEVRTSNKPMGTMKNIQESAITDSGVPKRTSQAKSLFPSSMDIVSKVCIEAEHVISPKMVSSKHNPNITYNVIKTPKKKITPLTFDKTLSISPIPEESPITVNNNYLAHLVSSSIPISYKKNKSQKENNTDGMRIDAAHALPLTNGTPTTPKIIKRILKTYKVKENEAGKRKEYLYLKSNANQKYYNSKMPEQHLNVARSRNVIKNVDEKFKNTAEKKRETEEKELPKKTKIIPKCQQSEKSKTLNVNENAEINNNDYGINDVSANDSSEDESKPKNVVPDWAKRENWTDVHRLQCRVDSGERDMFFDYPKRVDLKEIFKGYGICDKQRTSSAVWNTPPRPSSGGGSRR